MLAALRELRLAARDAPLDPAQREPHGRAEPFRRQQALRQIVHRAELQGADGGELVAVLGEREHRRESSGASGTTAAGDAFRARILRMLAERQR